MITSQTPTIPETGLRLVSRYEDGILELFLETAPTVPPASNQVVVRVEAAPLNPSDMGPLLGSAVVSSAASAHGDGLLRTTLPVPPSARASMAARAGLPIPVGNEGAGTIIAAGSDAGQLLGRRVAVAGGGMYAQYRTVSAADCMLVPDDVTAEQAASSFVNPLTALGMVENMRMDGHHALVHTAAASNLGQMLVKLCLEEDVPLVNVVRNSRQVALLRTLGARHVCDSSTSGFLADLTDSVAETGATMAFDAIGGGRTGGAILAAMEAAAMRGRSGYEGYGSGVFKQLYVYGSLDTGPMEIVRGFGVAWGINGWLLPMFMTRIAPARAAELRSRVMRRINTTFASHYTRTIGLSELLEPGTLEAVTRKATGEKYLLTPWKA